MHARIYDPQPYGRTNKVTLITPALRWRNSEYMYRPMSGRSLGPFLPMEALCLTDAASGTSAAEGTASQGVQHNAYCY